MPDHERILIVDDADDSVEFLRRTLELNAYVVWTARSIEQALVVLKKRPVDLVVVDQQVSGASGLDLVRHLRSNHRDTDVVLISGHPDVETAVLAVRHGAVDYLPKPVAEEALLDSVRRALKALRSRRLISRKSRGVRERFPGIIGESPNMLTLFDLMDKASKSSVNVLVHGEFGTGKDLVARAIHHRSARARAPFVSVHCGAIPEDCFEAELFGRVDARGRTSCGLLRAAHRGSLFIDQISAASLANQDRLLRWLEGRRFTPIGAKRSSRVDVRVFAGTDRDLRAMSCEGSFREALLYKLAIVELEVPSLRERGNDIWLLARAIASNASKELRKPVPEFSDRVLALLGEHGWPGNVRELAATIQRLVALSDGGQVDAPDLPSLLRYTARAPKVARTLDAVEAEHIRRVVAAQRGNQSRAAAVLGIDRKTLRAKLKRMQS